MVAPRGGYWFPAKKYGWGWGAPRNWQGWLTIGAFISLMLAGVPWFYEPQRPWPYLAWSALLAAALTAICWKTGEPPRWRWGDEVPPKQP